MCSPGFVRTIKRDGTLRLCINWCKLNSLFVLDCRRPGDSAILFNGLRGKECFNQLGLASGYHQLPIPKVDRHNTAFIHADNRLFEYMGAGFGLTVLPTALSRIVK